MDLFMSVPQDELNRLFQVNFFALLMLVNRLLKAKRLLNDSSVVVVSSLARNWSLMVGIW